MHRTIRNTLLASAAALMPAAADAGCVENGTDQTLFFTIEARDTGVRRADWLMPEATLCLPGGEGMIFTAFASDTSVEGCPRISGPDGGDRLVQFVPTDSCRWASHGE